jgi:hypothetical protein
MTPGKPQEIHGMQRGAILDFCLEGESMPELSAGWPALAGIRSHVDLILALAWTAFIFEHLQGQCQAIVKKN